MQLGMVLTVVHLQLSKLFNKVLWTCHWSEFRLIDYKFNSIWSKRVIQRDGRGTIVHIRNMNDIPFCSVFWLNAHKPPFLPFSFNFWDEPKLHTSSSKFIRLLLHLFECNPFVSVVDTSPQPFMIRNSIGLSLKSFEKSVDSWVWEEFEFVHWRLIFNFHVISRNKFSWKSRFWVFVHSPKTVRSWLHICVFYLFNIL